MKTRTATRKGNPVGLEPLPVGRVRVTVTHPTQGEIRFVADGWGRANDGQEGIKGIAHHKGKDLGMVVTVPRSVFDSVLAESVAMRAQAKADSEAKLAADRGAALAQCPADCEIARRNWSNGDLCSAEYEAADGTKTLDSDLIQIVHGWAFILREKFEAERAKVRAVKSREELSESERLAKREAAFVEAKTSGKPVAIRQWTTGCGDPKEECSCDTHTEWAQPNETTTTTRHHCW